MTSPDPIIQALRDRLNDDAWTTGADGGIRELGWALVTEGQIHIAATSSDDDVELFFETYGHPRAEDPTAWVGRIAAGLQQRLTPAQWDAVAVQAIDRAASKITSADRATK